MRKLLWAGYAEILRGLIDAPATWHEVFPRHCVSANVARRTLRRMHDMRLIHISGWQATKGPATAIWAFGDKSDVPRPLNKTDGRPFKGPGSNVERAKPQPELATFATLIRALQADRLTCTELAEATGVHYNSARRFIARMQSLRLVRIAGWEQRLHGGTPARLFEFAIDRPNAARPKPQPRAEIHARYQAARKRRRHQLRALRAIAGYSSAFTMQA